MNPIVPVNDTRVAVTRDTMISDRSLMRLAFTPRLTASLSHIARMLSFLDRSIMATTPTMAAETWNQMLSQVDFPRVPMFHTYISDRDSSDAVSFMNVVAAVKKYMTAIPMRIMVAGDTSFLNVDMMTIMAAGIPMICYESADATAEITTVLTLGFLFGGECETMGVKYAQTAWNLIKEINDKLKDVKDEDKTSYICCTMYIYICGASSSFNTSATTAGGVAYASLNSDFNSTYTKNSTKMTSVEALSKFTDVDVIINNRSMDWGLTAEEIKDLVIDTWDHDNSGKSSTEYFAKFLDKLVYIDNLLPGAVKLAYMAHAMYGDTFSREWADGVLQDYIDLSTYNAVKA